MRRIILAASLALALGGCAGTQFGEFTRAITTTYNNPVSTTDIYRVKNTYAAGLELAVEYRRYCWSAAYRVLMADPVAKKLCSSRRVVVRAIQRTDEKAFAAIAAAENFVRDHPTISAIQMIGAASQAVADFRNAIPAK